MSKVTTEMVRVFREGANFVGHLANKIAHEGLQALFDAKLISLPVDEAAIRESVVRECIAALPPIATNNLTSGQAFRNRGIEDCLRALQSLLPTKDRAEELAEEYWRETHGQDASGGQMLVLAVNFARWLIERENANG